VATRLKYFTGGSNRELWNLTDIFFTKEVFEATKALFPKK
jgi:hypothetical protein